MNLDCSQLAAQLTSVINKLRMPTLIILPVCYEDAACACMHNKLYLMLHGLI